MEKTFLGTQRLSVLIPKLALPAILAQVINILYNIVDRVYIGHIKDASSLALTGLGICFPIITLISAFAIFAGAGGAPLAAIALGKAETDNNAKDEATAILGNSVIMLLFFCAALTVFFYAYAQNILTAFGASNNTLPYALDYLGIYLIGTIFVFCSVGLNPFITCQGHARTAMCSTIIGAITNIVLDPIFIFVFNMGVKGAALATIISQSLSAIWILAFLTSKKSSIKLTPSIIRFNKAICLKITSLGVSPFIMSSTESAIFIVFNSGLQKYGGDIYVGAMTIMQSLMQLLFVPVSGFTDGVYSIISYNYGAKKINRVKKTIKIMTSTAFIATTVFSFVIIAFRKFFAGIFSDNNELIQLVTSLLPIYFGATWIFGIQLGAQRTFVALGKAKTSAFIALLRKVILLIPLALILPKLIGVNGLIWAEPIASTTSAVTSFIFLIFCLKSL